MALTMTSESAIASKLGIGVSASWTDNMRDGAAAMAEATCNTVARFNFTEVYDQLNQDTALLLSDIVSALTAIEGIAYDFSGYPSRIVAEDKINILRDSALRGLSLLRDKKQQDFINAS